MPRSMADADTIYRVRVQHPGISPWTNEPHEPSYFGPFGTKGAAKGVMTREKRYYDALNLTLEVATTEWSPVIELQEL